MVREPLLGQPQLVLHREPGADQVVLLAMSPGPAGVVEVPFEQGVVVSIDVAASRQLCDVAIEGVSGDQISPDAVVLLRRLLGTDRVAELSSALQSKPNRPHRLQGATSTGPGQSRPSGMASVAVEMASLALALEQSTAPGVLPHEWALLTLQSAVMANRLGLLDDVVALADDLQAAVLLLTDPKQQGSWLPLVGDSQQASELCRDSADLVGDSGSAAALALLAGRLASVEGAASQRSHDGPNASRMPRRKAASSVPAMEAADSLNRLVGAPELELLDQSGDELMARIRTWGERAEGWWLRVFFGDDAEPVAVAPFQSDPFGDAVARFLVAARHRDALHLEVVEDPSAVRVPPEVQAFRRAIAVGQRAARLERTNRATSATVLWSRCADWHHQAGDEARAGQAGDIAHRSALGSRLGRPGELPPLVTDEAFAGGADDAVTL